MARRSSALTAAVYAALAALVAAGAFTGLDQWAVDHAMPGAEFRAKQIPLLESILPLAGVNWSNGWDVAANLVLLPAAVLVSLVILVALRRYWIAAACIAGDAVELLCKHTLVRPSLHSGTFHISGFDSSFPSGHTLRAVLVAAAVASAWPRHRVLAGVWLCAALALLLLAGWHTPTDIAGGIVLGALALLGARAARALRARRLRGAA